ncbi:class D beta-lactamase [Paenibacillus sp. CGMCC 1.16610]|uniref:Beta-lactamase n=1 Tax=Paenibacillus anseongense TaxID=2682845 RepID=A0ABW9U7G9_9BACL|nr:MULTISPECIES: class D beta-lactamase [Paenibacillus]MBA2942548.1 class D beta-lactamase [Paenibacillus sp. CGMCC 1.16610]MVQ35362.1 class D beta-lactamase [Paenibacillus anseongense]
MKVIVLLLITLLFTSTGSFASIASSASAKPGNKELHVEELFHGISGTIVIKNLKTDNMYTYNLPRSTQRFTPESSFKVPNALIGLEEHAVEDEYEVKRWDGIVREFDIWNRDHTLASAMRNSAIWYYQAMARDIGPERMQSNLNRIGYGNQDISGGIDKFWLNSSLTISAQEQVQFIENLVEETLPFHEQTMKTVKRIMIDNEQDAYTVHGKTGTRLSDMGLGWYIGYVETDKASWVFATNVDSSGTTAKTITLECLKQLHIL